MVLVFMASLAALALCYIYILIRRTDVGFISVLIGNLYLVFTGDPQSVVGGYHLSGFDAVLICLLVAGVARAMRRANVLTLPRVLAFVFIGFFALSLVRGFYSHGIATASNESRGFVGTLIGFLYFLDADVDERSLRLYVNSFVVFSLGLCGVAVLAALGFHVGTAAIVGIDIGDQRYIPAQAASALAVSWVLSLGIRQYHKRGIAAQVLPIIFLTFAIYMSHRTVWMMLLVATIMMVLVDQKMFLRVIPSALLAAIGVLGLAVYGNTHDTGASENDFSDSASNSSTLVWRVNSWEELFFDEEQTPFTVFAGKSMGSGYWRIDPDTHILSTAPPHDEWLQEYLRVGIIGLLCIFSLAVRPVAVLWLALKRGAHPVYPSISAWIIILAMFLVFSITYSLDSHQYALIAIANAIPAHVLAAENEDTMQDHEIPEHDSGVGLDVYPA